MVLVTAALAAIFQEMGRALIHQALLVMVAAAVAAALKSVQVEAVVAVAVAVAVVAPQETVGMQEILVLLQLLRRTTA
jgi:hypothetical protein